MKKYLLLVAVLYTACSTASSNEPSFTTERITIRSDVPDEPTVELLVEVADEPSLQAIGLMNRTELPEGTGMLFVFEEEAMRHFWMKNTLIPLDIAFFNAKKELVALKTMEPCTADPCPKYSSSRSAQYALELPAGYLEKNKIDIGWRLGRKF